jgi:triacylglycerol esterase/lipase EstA (alpha/beta hydrolase family)
MTDYNDDYDDALQYVIEEIINEIHRVKELEGDRVDAICFSLFGQDIEQKYKEYIEDLKL